MLGQHHSVTCNIFGVEHNDLITLTYKWIKENGTAHVVGTNSKTLNFSPVKTSDAAQYICNVIIRLNQQSKTLNTTHDLYIQGRSQSVHGWLYNQCSHIHLALHRHTVPNPTNVTVESHPASPICPIGSDVTLTCTVKLSSAVDVPVFLNIQWTSPDQFVVSNTLRMFTLHTTVNTTITSFTRSQSGNYTCTATVYSASPFHTGNGSLSGIAEIGQCMD